MKDVIVSIKKTSTVDFHIRVPETWDVVKIMDQVNDEYLTTQTCSDCGVIGGPKGRKGLGVREWVCSECHTVHDRDVNAALNILRMGHHTLALK